MSEKYQDISITVNGCLYHKAVKTSTTLVDFLREELKFKGTKKSCDNGECGACSVLMNGRLVYSCHVLAVSADQANIVTIEGLNNDAASNIIAQTLADHGAIQCGYCTPGLIMAIKTLLKQHPNPEEGHIRNGLSGNICRCTGYVKIESAVKDAAQKLL